MYATQSSASPYHSMSGQSGHVDRMVTGIFRDLATNETLVSLQMNQTLSMTNLTRQCLS